MATYDTYNMPICQKLVKKTNLASHLPFGPSKSMKTAKMYFGYKLGQNLGKSNKKRPFSNLALNQLNIVINHFLKVLAVSTSA
jgi:hypothetical protein